MIIKGNTHDNGVRLARYLTMEKSYEHAMLWDLRGFASREITAAFRTVEVIASGSRCQQPFFHVQVRNPEGEVLARSQWDTVADRIERSLGLRGQPRAIAVHIDRRTGHEHLHVAWSRMNEDTLTATPLPFYKLRLKTLARELETELGLTPVKNHRASPFKYGPTRAQDAQSRRLGVDVHEIRQTIHGCFERSDCGRGFQAALALEGLTLARGDRRDYIVVDRAGGIHAVGKRILGVSAAQTRQRLSDLDAHQLPNLEQAREHALRSSGGTKGKIRAKRDKQALARNSEPPAIEKKAVGSMLEVPNAEEGSLQCEQDHVLLPPLPELRREAVASGTRPPEFGRELTLSSRESEEKRPRSTSRIRQEFRRLIKLLTGRPPELSPKARRRKNGETSWGVVAAAKALLQRVTGFSAFESQKANWDAFTWLRIWDYHDPTGIRSYDASDAGTKDPSDLSPRL
jgi:hypothetical protein